MTAPPEAVEDGARSGGKRSVDLCSKGDRQRTAGPSRVRKLSGTRLDAEPVGFARVDAAEQGIYEPFKDLVAHAGTKHFADRCIADQRISRFVDASDKVGGAGWTDQITVFYRRDVERNTQD